MSPAEFLKAVTGEGESKDWQPKWGEEVEVSDDGVVWTKDMFYVGNNPKDKKYRHVVATKYGSANPYRHIRPARKSVRDEVCKLVAQHYDKHHQTITDEIMNLIKERKDEL